MSDATAMLAAVSSGDSKAAKDLLSVDYDEYVRRELKPATKPIPRGVHWFWWLVAIVLVSLLALTILR
jgi:hypothetical protein